jgi:hypothetical protein
MKSCDDGESIGKCWPSSYSNLNGSSATALTDGAGLVLASGQMLMFSGSKILR